MIATIPKQLIDAGARYVRVDKPSLTRRTARGDLAGKNAFESAWEKYTYSHDDKILVNWLAEGGNYGVISHAGIGTIDIDYLDDFKSLGLEIPDTFTDFREGKRFHVYYKCENVPDEYKAHKKVTSWGDIRLPGHNSYVVGTNCVAPNKTNPPELHQYVIYNDSPVKTLDWSVLKPIVEKTHDEENTDEIQILGNQPSKKKSYVMKDGVKKNHYTIISYVGKELATGVPIPAVHAALKALNENGYFDRKRAPDELTKEVDDAIDYCVRKQATDKKNEPKDSPEELSESQVEEIRKDKVQSYGELPELPDGFFKDYMDFGKSQSYAYPAYHLAGSLVLTSMILGRRVCMENTSGRVYPNVYAMCVGQTSISGKSTANDFVERFFSLVRMEGTVDELPTRMSPAGFIQRVAKIPCRLWLYDECNEFFSDTQSHWAESLEQNLCKAYDGRGLSYGLSEKKKETSDWTAKDVFVSALWNTTDTGIEQELKWRSVSSGFVPRFMWFWMHCENTPRKNRDKTEEDVFAEIALQKKIQDLRNLMLFYPMNEPSIIFTTNEILEDWRLEDSMSHLSKEHELHRIATARLVPQAYKIAMLFTILDENTHEYIRQHQKETKKYREENPNGDGYKPLRLKIPGQYAQLAKEIAETYLRPRLEYVINLAKYNDSRNFQDQIRKCIEAHGSIASKSQIIRDTRIQKRDLESAIDTMIEGDVIKEYTTSDGKSGRKSVSYQLI